MSKAGTILETLARRRGFSNLALARASGVEHSKISRMRRGIQGMWMEDAEALAAALSVRPEVFFMSPVRVYELELEGDPERVYTLSDQGFVATPCNPIWPDPNFDALPLAA